MHVTRRKHSDITINAITIGTENSQCDGQSLSDWYGDNAVTDDGFLETAANFADFEEAIARKIGREIDPDPVPEPASVLLIAAGMLGLGIVARRRRQ